MGSVMRAGIVIAAAIGVGIALAPRLTAPVLAQYVAGDVTCDQRTNSIDALLVLQYEGTALATLPCGQNADLDSDDDIDSIDAALILQRHSGLLPVDPSDALRNLPTACPSGPPLSNGTIMANQMLSRGNSDLHLDRTERDRLADELDHVLGLIASVEPRTDDVRIFERNRPGRVLITMSSELETAVRSLTSDDPASLAFVTGFDEFDALNAKLRLRAIHVVGQYAALLALCFPDTLNISAAVDAYSTLGGVRAVSGGLQFGSGPDIQAEQSGDTWYVVIMDAWGDCPSGCTKAAFFFFTATSDSVVEIEQAQALEDPLFEELFYNRLGRK